MKKPNHNLPNALLNFNDKPDSTNYILKQQLDSSRCSLNKTSSLNALNSLGANNNKKNFSSTNYTNLLNSNSANQNTNNLNLNNISNNNINLANSSFTGNISDFKFFSNTNPNNNTNTYIGSINNNNIYNNNNNNNNNINSNNNYYINNSKIILDKTDNKQIEVLFQDNKINSNSKYNLSSTQKQCTYNINNSNLTNNTQFAVNSSNPPVSNNFASNTNNNNNNRKNQAILNTNPVCNGLNLNLIINKMLNMKRHFDSYYSVFSCGSSACEPEKLKKCMLETHTLIMDFLKHLNNLIDEVRKYSYYLSLVFTKTDKLKDSINEIFPHLESIVNQIQFPMQQGDDKQIKGLAATLGHAICVNDLLRLCKFELSDVQKVKSYAKDNIVSEDLLRIFTVFLNLGKNQSFVSSLLGLFRNIKGAKEEHGDSSVRDEEKSFFNNFNQQSGNNIQDFFQHDLMKKNNENNFNTVDVLNAFNSYKEIDLKKNASDGYCHDSIHQINNTNNLKKEFICENINDSIQQEQTRNMNGASFTGIYDLGINNNGSSDEKKFDLINSLRSFIDIEKNSNETIIQKNNEEDKYSIIHNNQNNDVIMKAKKEVNENSHDLNNIVEKHAKATSSVTNAIEITSKILFESNFSSPLLEIINKFGLFSKEQKPEEKGALETKGNTNHLIMESFNTEKNSEMISDRLNNEIKGQIKSQNESIAQNSNITEPEKQERNVIDYDVRKELEEGKNHLDYLLEIIKKRIEMDCIPCKVDNNNDNDYSFINNINCNNDLNNGKENNLEQSLEINKILDIDNNLTSKEKVDIDFETLKKKRYYETPTEEVIEKKVISVQEAIVADFIDKDNCPKNHVFEAKRDNDYYINNKTEFDQDNDAINVNQMKSSSNYFQVKRDNIINSISSCSEQGIKEEVLPDCNVEPNSHLNPISNLFHNNQNPLAIFKLTKGEVSSNNNKDINVNESNDNHYNKIYNSIYNTNSLSRYKNLSPQLKTACSKFLVLSNQNNNNNNNESFKARLSPNNNPTSNNKNTNNNDDSNSNNKNNGNLNIQQSNSNNPNKSEEKKKEIFNYNDPDDSGNIQEHFNVNGLHDNIINDEPIKNTIFKPGFENPTDTASPMLFNGRRTKNTNNIADANQKK